MVWISSVLPDRRSSTQATGMRDRSSSAVKGVSAVVSRELIGPSVEREAAAADAVGKAADDRAEVMARLARVTVEIGESEHDVHTPAFPVG